MMNKSPPPDWEADIDKYYSIGHGFLALEDDIPERFEKTKECQDLMRKYEDRILRHIDDFREDYPIHEFRYLCSYLMMKVITLEKELHIKSADRPKE